MKRTVNGLKGDRSGRLTDQTALIQSQNLTKVNLATGSKSGQSRRRGYMVTHTPTHTGTLQPYKVDFCTDTLHSLKSFLSPFLSFHMSFILSLNFLLLSYIFTILALILSTSSF